MDTIRLEDSWGRKRTPKSALFQRRENPRTLPKPLIKFAKPVLGHVVRHILKHGPGHVLEEVCGLMLWNMPKHMLARHVLGHVLRH